MQSDILMESFYLSDNRQNMTKIEECGWWTRWNATYAINGENEICVKYKPWRTRFDNPPAFPGERLVYVLDGPDSAALERFIEVNDCKTLLHFLRSFGLPHVIVTVPKEGMTISVSARPLLEAATTLRWVFHVLYCFKKRRLNELKPFCVLNKVGHCSYELSPSHAGEFRYWSGLTRLRITGEPEVDDSIRLHINASEEEVQRGTWTFQHSDVLKFLTASINYLVEGISPRLVYLLRPTFSPRTPYEAMCLSLFQEACGLEPHRVCARPGCTTLIFLRPQPFDKRKQRSDSKYCTQKCRQYVYDEAKRGRKVNKNDTNH